MAKTQKELKDEELMEVAGGVGLLDENDDDSSLELNEDETLEGNFLGARRPKDGIIPEERKREHYEKPSTKRKKKGEAARKRARKY